MSNFKTTFLDLPLERELYVSRPCFAEKPPIRILITDAGQKFVYCLLYKICSGAVFGPDQEVFIHLVNSKGVIDHKSVFLELEECGFHLLKGWVATSNVEESFKDVDFVVLSTTFEEQSGVTHKETFIGQIIRVRQLMKHIAEYSKPNVKVIVTGPSTKYVLVQLSILHRCEPSIPSQNLTAVTLLDEAIARANLAARLQTTTNKIKNIIIWGITCPDVHNATVRMFPPGDLGALEEVDVPVHEALQDDNYLHGEFVKLIFRRQIGLEFSRSGKSMATATARHLRALHLGSEDGEIISMGVLTPDDEPFMVPRGIPFSFPVKLSGNGKWEIRKDLKYDVRTHLNLMRTVNRVAQSKTLKSIHKIIDDLKEYEEIHNESIPTSYKQEIMEMMDMRAWDLKYFVAPLPSEAIPKTGRERIKTRKSIAWDDTLTSKKSEYFERKSSIRFSFDETKKSDRKTSILKRSVTEECVVLPPIEK